MWLTACAQAASSNELARYYTPGILYAQVVTRAALLVRMTLVVFVLHTVKYVELAVRYPGGGAW